MISSLYLQSLDVWFQTMFTFEGKCGWKLRLGGNAFQSVEGSMSASK